MTPSERQIAAALGQCSFLPGTSIKYFARDLSAQAAAEHVDPAKARSLTARQRGALLLAAWRFRRQLGMAVCDLVRDALITDPDFLCTHAFRVPRELDRMLLQAKRLRESPSEVADAF